jgi:hypothetical protein
MWAHDRGRVSKASPVGVASDVSSTAHAGRTSQCICTLGATFIASLMGTSYGPALMRPAVLKDATHEPNTSRPSALRLPVVAALCSVVLGACGVASDRVTSIRIPSLASKPAMASRWADPSNPEGRSSEGPAATETVVMAWLAAEQAFNTAALTADPGQPDLAATTVAPQLDWSRSLLTQMAGVGDVARGSVDYGSPHLLAGGSDTAAIVQSCIHDAEVVVSTTSGRPVAGVAGQVDNELITSTMVPTVNGWKLATQTVGVGRCG